MSNRSPRHLARLALLTAALVVGLATTPATRAEAQHTGGSFGGSAWGGGSSRPQRTKTWSTKNTGYGSGYDYGRNRYGQGGSGGGAGCAASLAMALGAVCVGLALSTRGR